MPDTTFNHGFEKDKCISPRKCCYMPYFTNVREKHGSEPDLPFGVSRVVGERGALS